MGRYCIHYENIHGSAISNIGDRLVEYLKLKGHDVVVDFKFNNLNDVNIINLLPHHHNKIKDLGRFIKIKDMVTVFTPNFEEYSPNERCSFLVNGVYNKIVFTSLFSYEEAIKFCKSYFSPSVCLDMFKNFVLLYNGIDTEHIKSSMSNNRNSFIVPFNRKNNQQKNYKLHCELSSSIKTYLSVKGFDTKHTFL